ncbi:putative long-chain fatty acid transporter [Cryomyces antarcticus]
MAATLPLSLALPAAAASLAYLNARLSLFYDYNLLGSFIAGSVVGNVAQRRDRVNLFYVLEGHALNPKTASNIFLIYQNRQWTYKEAYERVLQYATWLKRRHAVAKGEIVAMDFTNSELFIWMWWALWALGAKPAFVNYNLRGDPLLHCIRTSTARLLFVDEEVKAGFSGDVLQELSSGGVRDGKDAVETVFFSKELELEILATDGVREPDEARGGVRLQDMAILIYTSGTTGLPKPAVVSWSKVRLGGYFVSRWLGLKKGKDRFYTVSSAHHHASKNSMPSFVDIRDSQCMPLYHTSASSLGLSAALQAGSTFILGHRFSPSTFWPEVRASSATVIQYVGETCRYLLSSPPCPLDTQHKVRLAFGNGLRPDVWQRFQERFGIETVAEFYGATEGPSASWNLSRNGFSRGAVGRNGRLASLILGGGLTLVELDPRTDAPLRDPQTGLCRPCAPNEPGELLYKLPDHEDEWDSKYQGYYDNPAATASKILRNVLKKGDAWYRTGDLLRHDQDGRWWFSDRIGDTFRWKGENVSTTEVAELLGTHPAVREANVYGVRVPSHDGRAGCAAVVLDASGEPGAELLKDLAQFVKKRLPRYAVLIFLRLVSTMDVTGTMKMQKGVLREEGVEPGKVELDRIYWLPPNQESYQRFGETEWKALEAGRVKL